jgi:hypothetical protein
MLRETMSAAGNCSCEGPGDEYGTTRTSHSIDHADGRMMQLPEIDWEAIQVRTGKFREISRVKVGSLRFNAHSTIGLAIPNVSAD